MLACYYVSVRFVHLCGVSVVIDVCCVVLCCGVVCCGVLCCGVVWWCALVCVFVGSAVALCGCVCVRWFSCCTLRFAVCVSWLLVAAFVKPSVGGSRCCPLF